MQRGDTGGGWLLARPPPEVSEQGRASVLCGDTCPARDDIRHSSVTRDVPNLLLLSLHYYYFYIFLFICNVRPDFDGASDWDKNESIILGVLC